MNTIAFQDYIKNTIYKLFWFNDVNMHIINDQFVAHWHDCLEFLLCKNSTGKITCDNETFELNKNDTIIANSNSIHMLNYDTNSRFYCLKVNKEFFETIGLDIKSIHFKNHFNDSTAAELMENIYTAYYNETPDKLSIAKNIHAVLNYILYMCEFHLSEKPLVSEQNPKAHKAVIIAIKYMNENFKSKILIDDIANKVNYSKYHFSRIFKEHIGISIVEYINKIRLEHSRNLLVETDKPATVIYRECGFTSYTFFSQKFHELFGYLPDEYRCRYSRASESYR